MKNKPKFYVIEYNIFEDEELSSTDKLVYAIINNFRNSTEYTFATNKYFAKILNVSERNIQYSLKKLKEKNYINTFYHNNKRYIKSINEVNKIKNENIEDNKNIELDEEYDWLNDK